MLAALRITPAQRHLDRLDHRRPPPTVRALEAERQRARSRTRRGPPRETSATPSAGSQTRTERTTSRGGCGAAGRAGAAGRPRRAARRWLCHRTCAEDLLGQPAAQLRDRAYAGVDLEQGLGKPAAQGNRGIGRWMLLVGWARRELRRPARRAVAGSDEAEPGRLGHPLAGRRQEQVESTRARPDRHRRAGTSPVHDPAASQLSSNGGSQSRRRDQA